MTSRAERAAGENDAGEVTPKRLAEILGVAHGTAKRWIHEGLPRTRANAHETWVNLDAAREWLAKRFGGRKTIAFQRKSFVYVAERESDGAYKIGFSSDVMRRMFELRKYNACAVQLIA